MFVKYWGKIGDVRESLVRNGYEIYVTSSGVHFFYDAMFDHNQGVFDTDGELIAAFLNGRTVTAYYSMAVQQVEAPFSPVVPVAKPVIEPVVVEPVVAEPKPIVEVATEPVIEPVVEPVFKPELVSVAEPPVQSVDFLGVLAGADDEYVVYAKEDSAFHIHWKVSREQAKEVWRRDRSHIQKWLGVDVLNTVSWEKPSLKADTKSKWKEIPAEQTKAATVLRQVVAFGKPLADLLKLEDGTYHVRFHLPKGEAKQIYANIKAEFEGYEVASVSFESAIVMPEFTLVASDYARDDHHQLNQFVDDGHDFCNNNGTRAWIGESRLTGYHLHWYYCKETQRDEAIAFWKSHPEMHKFPIKTVSWEYLTRKDEWNDQFHCVDPINSSDDSIAISDKELYRFLTSRIDSKSLVQGDSFYHDGRCWTFRDSDLSLSTLAQLAYRIPFFSIEAKHNASRVAKTLLNGKTVILVE